MKKSLLFTNGGGVNMSLGGGSGSSLTNKNMDIIKHTYNNFDRMNSIHPIKLAVSNVHPTKMFIKPHNEKNNAIFGRSSNVNFQMKMNISSSRINSIDKKERIPIEKNIPIPDDYCFHFDPTTPINELSMMWALIDNTDNENLSYSGEDIVEYINIDTDFYFHCSNRMLLYKQPIEFELYDITLITNFVLHNTVPDNYPHLITMFHQETTEPEEGERLHYENILFQLFNDIISSSFHINTHNNELWSDHSLPIEEPIVFSIRIRHDIENENIECFYRINGIQLDIEYINHNNFIEHNLCKVNRIIIGGNNIANGGWMGYIGDMYLYNRALEVDEIMNIERKLYSKWDFE